MLATFLHDLKATFCSQVSPQIPNFNGTITVKFPGDNFCHLLVQTLRRRWASQNLRQRNNSEEVELIFEHATVQITSDETTKQKFN